MSSHAPSLFRLDRTIAAWTGIDPKERAANAVSWLPDGLGLMFGFKADVRSHNLAVSYLADRCCNSAPSLGFDVAFRFVL